ncbi:MAG: JAB domain-containing protein, partial [bacterium]|nr:JAB domain-containing protein [bacterium]
LVNLSSPASLCSFLVEFLGYCVDERLAAVFLDPAGDAVGVYTVALGQQVVGRVEPKEVFKGALLANASGVVVARCYSAGKCEAGWEDYELRRRLREVGDVCGIDVVDYIVVAGREWVCLGE